MTHPTTTATLGVAPGRLPVLGHGLMLLRRPLDFLLTQQCLGDIVIFWAGPKRAYLVNNPELVHQLLTTRRHHFAKGGPLLDAVRLVGNNGLITSEGELHRRQRRLIQPAFHPSRFPAYVAVITEASSAMAGSWHDGENVVVDREMYRLSARIMARSLYSGRLAENATTEIIRLLPAVIGGIGRRAAIPIGWLHALPTPANRRFRTALVQLHRLADRLIADGAGPDDLLAVLLAARDEDTGEPMSTQQVHDEVTTTLTAGIENTAVTAAWALHLIGGRPDVADRIRAELDHVLGGRAVTYPDLLALTYLQATVTETLRLYPPVWLLPRVAAADTELGGRPIPAGSYVFFSPYASHHDPNLFPDPESFDPDRWHTSRTPPRCAHIPFGGGARKCIGDTFAIASTVTTLATVLRRWRLHPDPARPVRPVVAATLNPGRLIMRAERRH